MQAAVYGKEAKGDWLHTFSIKECRLGRNGMVLFAYALLLLVACAGPV